MTLSQVVEQEINRSPFLSEAMHAGIVNVSSLARLLHPEIELKMKEPVSIGAIGMAIKRLPLNPVEQLDKSISSFMKQLGDINVRSNLADFTFRNSSTLLKCQSNLLTYLEEDKSHFYSSCKGVHETTLICSDTLAQKVKEIFVEEAAITSRHNLAAVSVKLPPANLDTFGVYYIILKKLAWKGINLVEVLSTSHEITLIVSDDDVQETFAIILGLKNG